ncbi:hypothetical protein NKR23_g9717 [Pleurostoma richardsiae]|uniref:Uncharacterized protein n=1 Tax=Pleurostoma richardsiae TaxID=41990 RepID=A0AA38REN5_9PEZI|nr:hypothetical protein NKR23_g9717 [Pleurostoma richardsiae]
MTPLYLLPKILSFFALSVCLETVVGFTPLNITAISSRDGYSVLECWQLASVPVEAMSAINYVISGNTTKATWSVIRPQTTVGEAWAPTVQLSMILNGLIRITAPSPPPSVNSSGYTAIPGSSSPPPQSVAYIMPGTATSSLLIAADMSSTSYLMGHYTEFPSDEETILVQVPFAGNEAPEHSVIYEGPCSSSKV